MAYLFLTFASNAACIVGVGAGVPGVPAVGLVALPATVGFALPGVGPCGFPELTADAFMPTK